MEKKIAKIWILLLIFTVSFFAFLPRDTEYLPNEIKHQVQKEIITENKNSKNEVLNNVSISNLSTGEEKKVEVFEHKSLMKVGEKVFELSFNEGDSLYDAMENLRAEGKLNFSGKNFPVLGFFVEEIEHLKEGNDDFLFFYVNGIESGVGISTYKLKRGDNIEWRLK